MVKDLFSGFGYNVPTRLAECGNTPLKKQFILSLRFRNEKNTHR